MTKTEKKLADLEKRVIILEALVLDVDKYPPAQVRQQQHLDNTGFPVEFKPSTRWL